MQQVTKHILMTLPAFLISSLFHGNNLLLITITLNIVVTGTPFELTHTVFIINTIILVTKIRRDASCSPLFFPYSYLSGADPGIQGTITLSTHLSIGVLGRLERSGGYF